MNPKFIITVVLLLLEFNVNAQDGWYWLNPLPQGNSLTAVDFTSPLTAWAVGEFGACLKTTNGGDDWSVITLPTSAYLGDVCFTDDNNGTIIGANGLILRTNDGGLNWIQQYGTTKSLCSKIASNNFLYGDSTSSSISTLSPNFCFL